MPPEPLDPDNTIESTLHTAPFPTLYCKPLHKPPISARKSLLPLSEFTPVRQTAAAAKLNFIWDQSDMDIISLSPSCWDYAYNVTIPLDPHPHAGLSLVDILIKIESKSCLVYVERLLHAYCVGVLCCVTNMSIASMAKRYAPALMWRLP